MSKQSELQLENNLIQQLVSLGYTHVTIINGDALISNLKIQLEIFNNVRKNCRLYYCLSWYKNL